MSPTRQLCWTPLVSLVQPSRHDQCLLSNQPILLPEAVLLPMRCLIALLHSQNSYSNNSSSRRVKTKGQRQSLVDRKWKTRPRRPMLVLRGASDRPRSLSRNRSRKRILRSTSSAPPLRKTHQNRPCPRRTAPVQGHHLRHVLLRLLFDPKRPRETCLRFRLRLFRLRHNIAKQVAKRLSEATSTPRISPIRPPSLRCQAPTPS